jgi:hypothetical protein
VASSGPEEWASRRCALLRSVVIRSKARSGSAGPGAAWWGVARLGLARCGSAGLGSVRRGRAGEGCGRCWHPSSGTPTSLATKSRVAVPCRRPQWHENRAASITLRMDDAQNHPCAWLPKRDCPNGGSAIPSTSTDRGCSPRGVRPATRWRRVAAMASRHYIRHQKLFGVGAHRIQGSLWGATGVAKKAWMEGSP